MRWFITMPVQLCMLVGSAALVCYFFNTSLDQFTPLGRGSFVKKVTPDVIKQWGHEPTHIKTGFLLHEFVRFDAVKDDFIINGILWFEFDPSKISLETLSKFSFTKGDILKQSDPVVKKLSENLSFAKYYLRVQFSSVLDYRLFPIDDHRLFLNLTHNMLEADEVIFDVASADYVVPGYIDLSGWKLVGHRAQPGYTEYQLSENQKISQQPKVLFSIDVKKIDARQLMILLLPLFILFYFFIFSVFIRDFELNIDSILTVLVAFMAYEIVVNQMSPDVGYFMLIDYLMIFFLGVFFILGLMDYVGDQQWNFSEDLIINIRAWSVVAVYVALIAIMYYVTHMYHAAG